MKRICVLLIFEGANHALVFLSKKDEPNPFSPPPSTPQGKGVLLLCLLLLPAPPPPH